MGKNWIIILLIFTVIFLGEFSLAASATPAAKIVSGVVTNVVSSVFKLLWSLKSTTKTSTVNHSRSMVKFEGGYTVETVFDGNKVGIEPYSLEVSPAGELLVLDSENSNIYRIPTPLSKYSRPKLVAGSAEGYNGHVDGRPREARLNHPKGLAMDDKGNIYVADSENMAIRKISDSGVVTIAGGKVGRGGRHVDGPSEDAQFSNDFDVVYVGSSCSLLVIDRGNRAIREIQLHEEDCSSQNEDENLPLGIAVLVGVAFIGYLLAFLQWRIVAIFSNDNNPKAYVKGMPPAPYQKPPLGSFRQPLIPTGDEYEKQDEGLFGSMGRLFLNAGSTAVEIFGGVFSSFKKKPFDYHTQRHYHRAPKHVWPPQESYMIPHEDAPPPLETRDPEPRKSYPYTTKDLEKTREFKQSQILYGGYNEFHQQQQRHHDDQLYHQHHQKHQGSSPQTHYEQEKRETNEIVFGAVQEQDGRREAMVIKAVDYSEPMYSNQNVRSRYNYMGYSSSSYGY